MTPKSRYKHIKRDYREAIMTVGEDPDAGLVHGEDALPIPDEAARVSDTRDGRGSATAVRLELALIGEANAAIHRALMTSETSPAPLQPRARATPKTRATAPPAPPADAGFWLGLQEVSDSDPKRHRRIRQSIFTMSEKAQNLKRRAVFPD